MDTGAPEPSVRRVDADLFIAYRCRNDKFPGWDSGAAPDHPGFDSLFAIIRFTRVTTFSFGEPSDETLANHSLFNAGASWYGFYVTAGEDNSRREWFITFHDNTLRVNAESSAVVWGPATCPKDDAAVALDRYLSGLPAA